MPSAVAKFAELRRVRYLDWERAFMTIARPIQVRAAGVILVAPVVAHPPGARHPLNAKKMGA